MALPTNCDHPESRSYTLSDGQPRCHVCADPEWFEGDTDDEILAAE